MTGPNKTTHRSRVRPSLDPSSSSSSKPKRPPLRAPANNRHGGMILRTVVGLVLVGAVWYYYGFGFWEGEGESVRKVKRSVTPVPLPMMMDLPQFDASHKESLYWGTYRPNVYLGIRARTPQSLIFGIMWLTLKNGQYHLRHVCQDSDGLEKYGWTAHDGRNYGMQIIKDNKLDLETSFLKENEEGSGFGGDWSIRLDMKSGMSNDGGEEMATHLFFYIADESGKSFTMNGQEAYRQATTLLVSGSREDIGDWQIHLNSLDSVEIHTAGYKSPHMHNLTELVQGTLAMNARRTGLIELPDLTEQSSNIMVYQISTKVPSKVDIAFLSGSSKIEERVASLTGEKLASKLQERQKTFEEKYDRLFDTNHKVNKEEKTVGKAAFANLLGGIGYFFGQSKIALPDGFTLVSGEKSVAYFPSPLFTAVPSRSFFPRGFLWDEGFHQLPIRRWDLDITLDCLGHWLDLLNLDGWIPREMILGEEALSKVPKDFVVQYPTNGNPPTLFLVIRDLLRGVEAKEYSNKETEKITKFLERAYARLNAWFQWFNTTQSGKNQGEFYWHGRDKSTNRQLNPQTLTSGFDDYPRASHPNDEERHVDLRCWMLLASNSMNSIRQILKIKDFNQNDYAEMSKKLSDLEILNQMHLDEKSGVYFDFGNHTEKVRLRWHEVRENGDLRRELVRETLEQPQMRFVPHIGFVSLFPFIMAIIPPESWILEKQLDLISNRSILWTDYGLRSLSKISTLYMKHNTEHDAPYWRGPVWINMNYLILSGLHHYSKLDGPYRARAAELYEDLRSNLIRNIVRNYNEAGYLFENYNEKNKGKGQGARPFTGWTSLVVLIMSESYPILTR